MKEKGETTKQCLDRASKPEVTVIMAVYNQEKEILDQAVDSILNQTFSNLELIICDDASTNGIQNHLKELEKKDPRIRLILNTQNRKAAYARNCCIREARGRYIAVMDDDDISAENRIQMLYDFLEAHSEYAFAGSKGEFFIQQVGDDGECYWYCEKPQPKDFLFSLPFVHASIMFRREALQSVRGYNAARYANRVEDYDMLLRLYAKGRRGKNLPEVLYYIRRDEKQYKRRKYRYRFHETYIKLRGFSENHLMPKGILYAMKPLIVGLIPIGLMKKIQKKYYGKKQG
ncbi:MAG: glycosyltransferase family 2 protein [Lachnospiraceae bacterium]